jgi:hypothetical protein
MILLLVIRVIQTIYFMMIKNYITIYKLFNLDNMVVPELKELNKCFQWVWTDINNLPQPLFLYVKNYINKSRM